MRRVSFGAIRTATLLATLAAPSAAAQSFTSAFAAAPAATLPSPRQIAARAHAALLVIRAVGDAGDTLGLGTGFMVGDDGSFVTNYHVIQQAAELRVKLLDGTEYAEVQVVGMDPASDLALLRIPGARGRPGLQVGRDGQMEVGDRVFVMGNPLGMSGTFTDGMVSGKRPLEGVAMLQISAPISPGSSGGPVMNERGEVIGIATMMVMGGQNLNMAVPAHYLEPLLAQHADARPFSPAVLVANPSSGLALVADGDDAAGHLGRRRPPARQPEREVEDQLAMIRPMLQLRGFIPAFPVRTGMMTLTQGASQEYTLQEGVSYIITGRCDAGCRDVDLALFDSRGQLVRADADGDDFPTIAFVPRASGSFRVTASIKQCNREPCAYGIGVFRRDLATTEQMASAKQR